MKLPEKVIIKEVGPRDGLQNEPHQVSTENKAAWIDRLSESGLSYIEVTSFVHPKWIPQLADAAEVLSSIQRKPGITYAALVPNRHGLRRALDAGVDEVSVFMSASESHNKNNINKSIAETLPVLKEVVTEAKASGKTVRGYLSTVIACPYEGAISPEQVREISARLFDMGIDELSLGETIGVAVPPDVERLLEVLIPEFSNDRLAMHFHDTRGTALANISKSLEMGIHTFDSSLGGLGGCPYAKGASGNVATEDLLYMLQAMGIETGIQMERLLEAGELMESLLGRSLTSRQLELYRKAERG
ncbi:hydroxymethylglutaryl-CoA lyase [Bacillus badius]|uniref:Hydroxymethylglutaryl-CoA lyase n=1 Tax=Bacillus badius TaxID=1455 RepID=A0ABR5B143_BACBA|nr:hydroxymethylglutaryl-CoA lyase [Bacillus badius]KIL73673.1 Hydroxymethylglutaryl-CoA lyase [Bacillus badius]KIL80681.1 Hydroxymethylglutaryl-CoA lyase [Bacillus badius]KZO01757.1 hydroxymethylglutaryl-CoA lyase [Bacillus badius]KZR59409.1 hydroxymethylglutaryl-CoA lyase [Bacillus badius]MED0667420.1 hydroxymethylglutaryl-CoA lyase [Bacillus badius]